MRNSILNLEPRSAGKKQFVHRIFTYRKLIFIKKHIFRTACIGVLLIICSTVTSFAQVANYAFTQITGTFTPISGGTALGAIGSNWDDASSSGQSIGFNFTYNGIVYSTFGISCNGYIVMGSGSNPFQWWCGLEAALPNMIAPFGVDLVPVSSTSGEVRFQTLGSGTSHRLVCQWKNCRHYADTGGDDYSFQLILNETSNSVQFVYGPFTAVTTMITNTVCSDAYNSAPGIGMIGSTTSDFILKKIINGTNTWSSPPFGSALTDKCELSSSNLPSSGLTWIWGCNGLTAYADADGDGYGDGSNSLFAGDCILPSGFVYDNTDCNDANTAVHATGNFYLDADGDAYGNPNSTIQACGAPVGYVANNTDCDDGNVLIHPGATEVINGIDDNCDGTIDDFWIQKADYGGGAEEYAVGFTIGSKGYIGTGHNFNIDLNWDVYGNDFWEYDPATNSWTQRANFPGKARADAVGFSIGSKGYIGTGFNHDSYYGIYSYFNDFWEYDPATNSWTQKANFGGATRSSAVGFSIDDKGYIGTGYNSGTYYKDFWEYDPTANTWTQKADFGGTARYSAVGFSIGSEGYIGTGFDGYVTNDFREYDPVTNAWTEKANFGGTARSSAVGFSIGSKGYIGTGSPNKDFWEYDPATNEWKQKAGYSGTGGYGAVGFSIGTKGYIGTGASFPDGLSDFWEYDPAGTCLVPTNLSATNIVSTSAKLNWDAVTGAEGYKVRYKVAGTSVWTKKDTYNPSKTINGLSPNTNYKWEVKTYCQLAHPHVSSDWSSNQEFTTGPLRTGDESPQQVSFQIYPNPAEDHATIQFTLPQSSHVYIKVYDVSGKEIASLLDGDVEQGDHSPLLNTNHFSKGIYLVKLISDFGIENQKLTVQ